VLRILPWVAAIVFALAAGFWRPRKLHWTALASVLLFAALNAGAAIYVLNHFNDPRWSPGKDKSLSAPSFSGTPIVVSSWAPWIPLWTTWSAGCERVPRVQQALPVALEFLAASGWALLASFPLAILAAGIGFTMARRAGRLPSIDTVPTSTCSRKSLSSSNGRFRPGHSGATALPSGHADSEVLPRPTRS
jgi:hypothetical protein